MTDLLNQGLMITAIGMSLVFLALIFLWGFINLISRIPFKDTEGKSEAERTGESAYQPVPEEPQEDNRRLLRARAAAAAVVTALALQDSAARLTPPEGRATTPWQATRRAGQFSINAQITTRKPRGSVR